MRGFALALQTARQLQNPGKRNPDPMLPRFGPGFEHCVVVRRMNREREERRVRRIRERPDHAGHVLERRLPLAPVGQRSRRLAFEIEDEEVLFRPQHLAEMVVAVHANA